MKDAETPERPWLSWPTAPTRPTEEIARLGREMYERDIRSQVEADHVGEVAAVDVDTGDWDMGNEALDAVTRLRSRCPEAINVFCERVGYRALRSFGAGSLRRTE